MCSSWFSFIFFSSTEAQVSEGTEGHSYRFQQEVFVTVAQEQESCPFLIINARISQDKTLKGFPSLGR